MNHWGRKNEKNTRKIQEYFLNFPIYIDNRFYYTNQHWQSQHGDFCNLYSMIEVLPVNGLPTKKAQNSDIMFLNQF